MLTPQFVLALSAKLVVDLFAGGGGASTGIEQAIGRHVDIAINHSPDAIGMHEINHPQTQHYCADVFEVDPRAATAGQPVGLLHASPDCTHFSQAKGGQPRSKEIRSLAWVVIRWAGTVRPDVITLENVEQMLQWSPLVAKRCPATGRVVTLDEVTDPATGKTTWRVAAPGEVVPRGNQFLVPSKKHLGRNWNHFVQALRDLGYAVQWRVICNADLGAHSTRTRLYMIARCDGLPIVWPEQTHAKKPKPGQARHRPAADCIDWSIPGKSIFGRDKPLVEATMRRIAYGMERFVLKNPQPFIVKNMAATLVQYELSQDDEAGAMRCAAFLMRYHGNGGQWSDLREPMTTVTTRDRLALVTVWLKGEPWVIVDITLRMLVPRELYNAQDFPPGYVIDRTAAGKPLTKTAQVRMAGNSVSPLPMRLIVAANYTEAQAQRLAA
ncbi:Uncharacterised protein [uncultured Comamonas sp.]|nr:Uncharacterised protein [uncultured Comamonas sp.]